MVSDTAPNTAGLDALESYTHTKDVGDHARTGGKSDVNEVYKGFADDVRDKLKTYQDKNVLVVVDVTDNTVVRELDPGDAERGLAAALSHVPGSELARLIVAIAILPHHIRYFRRQRPRLGIHLSHSVRDNGSPALHRFALLRTPGAHVLISPRWSSGPR